MFRDIGFQKTFLIDIPTDAREHRHFRRFSRHYIVVSRGLQSLSAGSYEHKTFKMMPAMVPSPKSIASPVNDQAAKGRQSCMKLCAMNQYLVASGVA